ncbi:MAG: ABC transporter permease [Myxococcales bacterium]|nr:FtsX-like permease family protein [Myxococcales bacterium]HIK84630.1 FtsX-like permease family protein [Myxococcales bacterium]
MTLVDLLQFAGNALLQNRRRSALSLVGVSIGVVAVVSLTAIGEGGIRFVADQFSSLGASVVIIAPGRNETTGGIPRGIGGIPNDLTLRDSIILERRIQSVRHSVPISVSTDTISFGQRSRNVPIIGATSDFQRLQKLEVASGQFLPEGEADRGDSVVVLGHTVAKELFAAGNPLGMTVRIGGWRMRVIGVLAMRGTQLGMQVDESVFIAVATSMRMANRSSVSRIMLELYPKADPDRAIEQVKKLLIERHDEEDFTCISQDAVLESLSSIIRTIALAIVGIAAISLAVAGIGIMNVMLVSVSERSAEVGLLKAIGATRRQILGVFLVEAATLSMLGGLLGLAAGTGLVLLGNQLYPAVDAATPIWAIVAVMILSLGTGVGFGVLPAWRAANLDPVAALQGH